MHLVENLDPEAVQKYLFVEQEVSIDRVDEIPVKLESNQYTIKKPQMQEQSPLKESSQLLQSSD